MLKSPIPDWISHTVRKLESNLYEAGAEQRQLISAGLSQPQRSIIQEDAPADSGACPLQD